MNDSDNEFEAELAQLRPVNPSRAVADQIESRLELPDRQTARLPRRSLAKAGLPDRRFRWSWIAAIAAAGLATAIAAILVMRIPPDMLLPVATSSVIYSTQDEGLVTLADGTPALRTRIRSIETTIWENPRTKASLRRSQPSEVFRDQPLAFN